MLYGLALPIGGACSDPHTLAEFAYLAEEAGWDGVFVEDYIVYQSDGAVPTCDPWVALAAMAMRTKRIRLGTMVTPLSRRRPWKVAREAVTLDHLSNGRFILGVGLGDTGETGFKKVGEVTDPRQRAEMLDEALDVLDGLWRGEPFSYQGKHFQLDDVTLLPRPLQKPRIPIWIGGGWPNPGPLQRAARWDGACLYKETHGGDWQDMTAADVQALRAAVERKRNTTAPFDIAVGGRERGIDWEQERELIQSSAEAGATWWTEWLAPAEKEEMQAAIVRGPLVI